MEAYCGSATTPAFQFSLRDQLPLGGFDHDRDGNLIVLQAVKPEFSKAVSHLTAYTPDGHVLATTDGLEYAFGLAVDRVHEKVYVYSPERSEEPIQGTKALFVRWSGRFAVFDAGSLRADGFVTTNQTETAADYFVDRNGMLWIYDKSDRGLVSLERRFPYNTCAIASGPKATLFAISCEGVLRRISTSDGKVIEDRDLGGGPVFGGLEARLAADSNANVYLYNAAKDQFSCYANGASRASSSVSGIIVYDILIDESDDVYVRGFDRSASTPSIDVYRGCSLKLIRRYPFYASAMTLVSQTTSAR